MSEPVETPTVLDQTIEKETSITIEETTSPTTPTTSSNKRPVDDSEETDNRESKTLKLDNEQTDKEAEDKEAVKTDETASTSEQSEESEIKPANSPSADESSEKPATSTNPPLINLAQGAHPPPPGLHLLSDPQQQQLLQSYVQAQGHDLANLTASSLAQAMVSPITVPTLASNLLHQLQQGGNIITALPGPPPQLPHQPPSLSQHNPAPLGDEAQGTNKRTNARSLSNDEKRQRRLLRNRVAAKECRKKKKKHIQDMEEKIVQLEEENAKLVKEVEDLKTKLSLGSGGENYLAKEIEQENIKLKEEIEQLRAKVSLGSLESSEQYRLMKEVEELNAKLSIGGALPTGGGAFTAAVMAVQQQKQQEQTSISDTSATTTTTPTTTTTTTTSTTAAIEPATRVPVVVPAPSSASDIESEAINNLQATTSS